MWTSMACATAGWASTQGELCCVSRRHGGICCRVLPRFSPSVSCSRLRSSVGAEVGSGQSRPGEPLWEDRKMGETLEDGNVGDIFADRSAGSAGAGSTAQADLGDDTECGLEAIIWASPVLWWDARGLERPSYRPFWTAIPG